MRAAAAAQRAHVQLPQARAVRVEQRVAERHRRVDGARVRDVEAEAGLRELGEQRAQLLGALADGSATLTAFAPTDRAFRRLVTDLTGSKPADEASAYAAAGTLGVDTIEQVLLYHVVLGAAVTYEQAQAADGAELTSALGPAITVEVSGKGRNGAPVTGRGYMELVGYRAKSSPPRPRPAAIRQGG